MKNMINHLPIVVQFNRNGNEDMPVWTFQVKAANNNMMSSAPPDMMIVATFNVRAAIKDWHPQ